MAALATAHRAEQRDSAGEDVKPHASVSPPTQHHVDDKKARQKTAEFLREAESNRRLIEKLQKERPLVAQCRKNGWTDVCAELEEYEKVLDGERKTEKAKFKKQLLKARNGVRKFQLLLTDVKPTPELIEKLKKIMSEVETSINSLKEEQRNKFEELLKEERAHRQEIAAYEKKIENWSSSVTTENRPRTSTISKTRLQERDVPSEVRALELYLNRTGGSSGGWDQFDHQAFLKVWTKFRGQSAYRKEAQLYLPSKTQEEIEEHEEWYKELIHLQDKRKEAIQRWKTGRQMERESRMHSSREETDEAKGKDRAAVAQAQRQKAEEEKREKALQLEKWKKEQQMREEEEEQQRLAEEMRRQRRAKEERRRQLEVKLILEEQLRLKREEEEEEQRRKREEEMRETEERRREATKGIKKYNERDLLKVEAKFHERQMQKQQEEDRQRRIISKLREKVEGHVSRDPSRLTRPTKGWEERMKNIGPSGSGPVLHMYHRAVPTWRQGL